MNEKGDGVTETAARSLDRLTFFDGVADDARALIERHCMWQRFAPHHQIIDRLDEAEDVFFVAEGQVRVVNYSLSGREVSFSDVGPGGLFGELSAIDGGPRSANVVALTETVVARVSGATFRKTVAETPDLALNVMRHLAGMVRRATERIMDLSTLGAQNRVHAEILRLAKTAIGDGNMAMIKPIPTHSEIASRVSTTRETVARVFGDLARDKLVERHVDHMLVRDYTRLEEMVEDVRGTI